MVIESGVKRDLFHFFKNNCLKKIRFFILLLLIVEASIEKFFAEVFLLFIL